MHELFVLPLGGALVDQDAMLLPGSGPGPRIWTPVYAFVIRGGGRVVLVDTGMHPAHIADPDHTFGGQPFAEIFTPQMAEDDRLERRLATIGLAPGDVTHVVNTHLHFDHAGNNALFAGVPILVQREHHEHATGHPGFPARYWDLPQLRYELVDGEGELLPGIQAILTPGHAPGHQSLLVTLRDSSRVLICADAILSEENLVRDSWETQPDPPVARASGQRLQAVAREHDALMIFGHDPEQARRLRYAPEHY